MVLPSPLFLGPAYFSITPPSFFGRFFAPLGIVQSYNLFGRDYIEDPATLESLAKKVERVMENPVKFAEDHSSHGKSGEICRGSLLPLFLVVSLLP